ncbi:LOW QUALITY PROTEIN: gastrin/cholecystokinin type B receptor-like [Hyla sarda]|uniref:LOW QUALITY PROTEIN: gastrin/cholecystokinin type B receptor-like n=1 Tax=Hyla sarda TaxID=327740 RepID=UPI0024C44949|nr:LOW QUALITY PROTEIN: gastrin/cholecystokinin type B receptor-like [Hyla sarda]
MGSVDLHHTLVELLPWNVSLFGSMSPGNASVWGPPPFSSSVLLSAHEPGTIVLVLMYSASFLAGLAGNIMALRVLGTRRRRRCRFSAVSGTRDLLVNLAVCDMMVICICMPINLGHQVHNAWVFGDFLCRAVPFVQAVSVSASVLTLAVISLNRYYSVHSPLHARTFYTTRRLGMMILVVWLFSSGLCVPLLFMNKTQNLVLFPGKLALVVCTESWPSINMKLIYNFLLFCALYVFPVLFNLLICFLTSRRLWGASDTVLDKNTWSLSGSRLKARKKIAKMVMALVLLFTLSWLPLYVVDIWIDINMAYMPSGRGTGASPHNWVLQMRPFAQWLGLTNSTLNPLCYCFVGNLYRSAKHFRNSYRERIVSIFSMSLTQAPGGPFCAQDITLQRFQRANGAAAQKRQLPDNVSTSHEEQKCFQ